MIVVMWNYLMCRIYGVVGLCILFLLKSLLMWCLRLEEVFFMVFCILFKGLFIVVMLLRGFFLVMFLVFCIVWLILFLVVVVGFMVVDVWLENFSVVFVVRIFVNIFCFVGFVFWVLGFYRIISLCVMIWIY